MGGWAVTQAMNIWVVGGDLRQAALAGLLEEDGHTVHTFALEQAEGLACDQSLEEAGRADCVVLPLPAAGERGLLNAPLSQRRCPLDWVLDFLRPGQVVCAGMAGPALSALATERGLVLRDYFAREELAIANAVPTAEGAVQLALEELPITLHNARCLVIGYGRVGRVLAHRLGALGARVAVAARSHEQLAWAEVWGYATEHTARLTPWLCGYDLVVNTVPARVLGPEQLSALTPGTLVIDLASKPGGVDFDAAARLGVKAIWALSLPGKTAPVSSGHYIKTTVYHILEEEQTIVGAGPGPAR